MNTRIRVADIPGMLTAPVASSIRDVLTSTPVHPATLDARPALAGLGLPSLTFTITPRRVRGVPLSTRAGRYLLTVLGEPPSDTAPGSVSLIHMPDGMTLDEARVAARRSGDMPPDFYSRAIMPGGAEIGPKGVSISVIDLTPGEWIVAGYGMTTEPTTLTVTGAMPATLPEPRATAAFTVSEMRIQLSSGSLRRGRNLIRIENDGHEPHFITIERVPAGTTEAHLEATMLAVLGEDPRDEALPEEAFQPIAVSTDQSAGTVMWLPVTLEAGTYAVTSWNPDPRSTTAGARIEMYAVLTVS